MDEVFSPVDASHQRKFAEQVLLFLRVKEHFMFPGNCSKKDQKRTEEAHAEARKLCKRLKNNRVENLYKDSDDWNLFK